MASAEGGQDRVDVSALPYRPCVGLMLLNPAGEIFAGQRIDNPGPAWQMPQGGIDKGETPADAAFRELNEETGIPASMAEILRESGQWLRYELPPALVRKLWKGRYRGQEQRWFAMRFNGPDSVIRIDGPDPEFSRWTWMPPDQLIERIVPFKRDTYSAVFDEFRDLLS